jgi:hypothetical protein
MLAAGVGLVTARIYLGRGGALLAALGFILIRGFIGIMVGGVWDQTTPTFPLYIVEALLVEVVFLRAAGRSPVATGALAGVLIGTIGLAAEWGWTHVWVHVPWTAALLPEALTGGLLTAVAGGAVGGVIGGTLTAGGPAPAPALGGYGTRTAARLAARLTAVDKRAALLCAVVLAAVLAWNVPLSESGPRSAAIALRDVESGPQRTVAGTIRMDPPGPVGDDPEFLNVTAWQGGGSVLDPLEHTGPGEYRTTKPIPVHGGWKATLRLQHGSSLVAVPIFQPEDRGIPARETRQAPASRASSSPTSWCSSVSGSWTCRAPSARWRT